MMLKTQPEDTSTYPFVHYLSSFFPGKFIETLEQTNKLFLVRSEETHGVCVQIRKKVLFDSNGVDCELQSLKEHKSH